MERTYYNKFDQLILEWTDSKGNVWAAPKDNVEILGKECFEVTLEELYEADREIPNPDECTWGPSDEEIQDSRKSWYKWLRDQEII